MIIYFEGPDGSGKSTMIDNIYKVIYNSSEFEKINVISSAENWIPTHPKASNRISDKELYTQLKRMANDNKAVFLVDRGPISDFIYRVFDNYNSVSTINKYLAFMNKYGNKVFTVYCRTDKAEEAMKERGDDNPVALTRHKELTKVYDMFMTLYTSINTNKYNFVRYDFTNNKLIAEVIDRIKTFIYTNYNRR